MGQLYEARLSLLHARLAELVAAHPEHHEPPTPKTCHSCGAAITGNPETCMVDTRCDDIYNAISSTIEAAFVAPEAHLFVTDLGDQLLDWGECAAGGHATVRDMIAEALRWDAWHRLFPPKFPDEEPTRFRTELVDPAATAPKSTFHHVVWADSVINGALDTLLQIRDGDGIVVGLSHEQLHRSGQGSGYALSELELGATIDALRLVAGRAPE